VLFSPDGGRVLTAGDDGAARLWELTTQPCVPPLEHEDDWDRTWFSRDGRRVLVTGRRYRIGPASFLQLARAPRWHAESGRPLAPSAETPVGVRDVRFSPDGRRAVLMQRTMSGLAVGEVGGREWLRLDVEGFADEWPAAEFSADGRRLLAATGHDYGP